MKTMVPALLYCTGVGKAILIFQPSHVVDKVIEHQNFTVFTATTLRGSGELRQELATIRARGHAYDLGEHEEDVRCVATPILNRDGFSLGGISISAPSYRIGEAFQTVWPGPVKQGSATIAQLVSPADREKLPLHQNSRGASQD